MKNFVFLAIMGSLLISCGNDINLADEGEPIPVVHAIFNVADTSHYVRVEKSFQDPKISPKDLAKDASALYYEDIDVKIKRSGSMESEFTLSRVNAAEEGYPRDTGFFADDPSYIYKFTPAPGEELKAEDVLTIFITIGENEPITGEIPLLGDFKIQTPSPSSPNIDTKIGFLPDRTFTIAFIDKLKRSAVFDIQYKIFYEEKADQSSPFVEKSFLWNVVSGEENEQENDGFSEDILFKGDSDDFYTALERNIEPATTEIRRLLSGQVIGTFGGEAILAFQDVVNANTGITSAQVIPVYSNLSQGRGIVSAVSTLKSEKYIIGTTTKTEVSINPSTQALNFQ